MDQASTTIGHRLRELRRTHGLTQEELAQLAGLSVKVIKKIEAGGTARMETYHQLARALQVTTVWFVSSATPEPVEATTDEMVLADMRAAVNPGFDLHGQPMYGSADGDQVQLQQLRRSIQAVARKYHRDQYDDVASIAPALIRSAHHHVSYHDSGPDHQEALRLRADITGLTGRYLIQIRAHDLALIAMHASLWDALEIGDMSLAASAVAGQAKAMLRQGRFDEIERLCVAAADEIEPRMSSATPDELCAWGYLLTYASSAASRNNRIDEAREYALVTSTAGTRLDREHHDLVGHRSFGPVMTSLQMPEVWEVVDQPGKALAAADDIPRGLGRTDTSTWNRHLLTVARAHVRLRNADRATEVLDAILRSAPEWLRHQQHARDTMREILARRPRMPSRKQRHLARFLDVDG